MDQIGARVLRAGLLVLALGAGAVAVGRAEEPGTPRPAALIRFRDGVSADQIAEFARAREERGLLTSWEARGGAFRAGLNGARPSELTLKELREDPLIASAFLENAPAPALDAPQNAPKMPRLPDAPTEVSLGSFFDGSDQIGGRDPVVPPSPAGGAVTRTPGGFLPPAAKPSPEPVPPPEPDSLLGRAGYFEARTQEKLTPYGLIGVGGDSAIWSGMYVASLAYRFSATKDPAALRQMEKSLYGFHAMSEITHVPGVFARKIDCTPRDPKTPLPDNLHEGSGPFAGCVWEGGGSFDQYLGYLYGIAEAWPLIQDPTLKDLLREDVRQIGLNFIRNDAKIIGPDTHLDSSPHYYYVDRWPKWLRWLNVLTPLLPDRGGNAMSGLHIMKVAAYVTGDPAFSDYYYKELIGKRHYDWFVENRSAAHTDEVIAKNLWWINILAKGFYGSDVKVTVDSMRGGAVGTNLSHVELYDLSRLERDPKVRASYLRALSALHATVAGESNTFWNFLAASRLGPDPKSIADGLDFLRQFPEPDRKSITLPDVPKYKSMPEHLFKRGQPRQWFSVDPLPIEARTLHSFVWQNNPHDMAGRPYRLDEAGGSAYLIAYWLGRSLGYIPKPDERMGK